MANTQTSSGAGTLVGYFDESSQAEKAVNALREAGFTSSQIGVARQAGQPLPTSDTATDAGRRSVSGQSGQNDEGVWDKIKSFFGSDPVEPYADERSAGDLANREVTPEPGYNAQDFHGTLTDMAVPEDRSRYFGHRFGSSDNGTLVTVTAPERQTEAADILTSYGADLGDNAGTYDYSQQNTVAGDSSRQPDGAAQRQTGMQNIQLLGEALRVHKDRVSRGEVTLRKEVTTEMKTIQVPVSREELVIERHAVADGTAPAGDIGDRSEIRIPLSEEQASAEKSTFVREEVAVGKRAVDDVRQLSGEVRSEELVVDDQTTQKR